MKHYTIQKVKTGYEVVLQLEYAVVHMTVCKTKKEALTWARQRGFQISKPR